MLHQDRRFLGPFSRYYALLLLHISRKYLVFHQISISERKLMTKFWYMMNKKTSGYLASWNMKHCSCDSNVSVVRYVLLIIYIYCKTKLSLSALKMFKLLCLLFILQIRYPSKKQANSTVVTCEFSYCTAVSGPSSIPVTTSSCLVHPLARCLCGS